MPATAYTCGMETHLNQGLKGDRPLGAGDVDRLGFREIAQQIATSLVDGASADGMVIGIEGTWGSGKSSLLALIREALENRPDNPKPIVLDFRPWLIGDRDALITSLFGALSKELDKVAQRAGDATPGSVTKAREARQALRHFVRGLRPAAAALESVGEAAGFSLLRLFGRGMKAVGDAVDPEATVVPLADLKEKLVTSLRALNQRFVITVDDVDRLEPTEVIEVLRLVRSVADLPNVIYVLCYDSAILAHSIEKAAGVASGRAYLEKIVQVTIMVPAPEPLRLRQWFSDELRTLAVPRNDAERDRLEQVIDYEGSRQLRTPRSVVRALDALRVFWPPLAAVGADFSDLVWIQLIKDGNPPLYRWIEEYCATVAVVTLGTARVDDAERERTRAALMTFDTAGHFQDQIYRNLFAEQLPGVQLDYTQDRDERFTIYERVSDRARDAAIAHKRLASPDHYRLYFALAAPSHALAHAAIAALWTAAEVGASEAADALLGLDGEPVGGSLTKADLFLERLTAASDTLTPARSEHLLLAFARMMDTAYQRRHFDPFWVNTLWDRARRLIPLLREQLTPERRIAVDTAMFCEGASVGWLTALFRHETFAHGRAGEQARVRDEWIYSDDELNMVTQWMLARYRALSIEGILKVPGPVSLLFAWRQGGDPDGPRRVVEAHIASDLGLVETLEALTGVRRSSDRGDSSVLRRDTLEPFMDYDAVVARTQRLASDAVLGARAQRLGAALEDGTRF